MHPILGHDQIIASLSTSWQESTLPQSLMLCGPKGIGKRLVADDLTRMIIGSASETMITQGTHPDIRVIALKEDKDGKLPTAITVDMIRQLGPFLHHSTSLASHKVVVIDSADDMNSNAANALLKMLEEPPSHTIMILISHAPGRLLPTIRSRCRKITLSPLAPEMLITWFREHYPELNEEKATMLAQLSGGSLGQARFLYTQDAIVMMEEIRQLLAHEATPNIPAIHSFAERFGKEEEAWECFMTCWQHVMRDMLVAKSRGEGFPTLSFEKLAQISVNVKEMLDKTTRIHLDKKWMIYQSFMAFKGS